MTASCRRSVRPRYRAIEDGYNGFIDIRLGPPALEHLGAACKKWGVTLNDLLLAILLDQLAGPVGKRDGTTRRHEIGVASIMNIRRDFDADVRRTFGQFLASFRISHPVPAGVGLREISRDVHRETARIKSNKLYLQSLTALAIGAIVWRFLSTARRWRVYAKTYPVWAGLSMLNVNALWNPHGNEQVPEYIRAASTGPLSPIVFAVTTAGDVLHAGITYRRGAFDAAEIDAFAQGFARAVAEIAS
jgi:hypothetical protein